MLWSFSDDNPLVGIYGRQTDSGIIQLGFITLNTKCQTSAKEGNNANTPSPEYSGKGSGIDGFTIVIFALGGVAFVSLIACSLCAFRT